MDVGIMEFNKKVKQLKNFDNQDKAISQTLFEVYEWTP